MAVTVRGLHDGDHKGGCLAVTIRGLYGGDHKQGGCMVVTISKGAA